MCASVEIAIEEPPHIWDFFIMFQSLSSHLQFALRNDIKKMNK